ncbi:flagellar biosynthetic protein FliO [Bartonella raoultii]|uniref:Flagellar biosynthetic protein FliO n=1 Tax=Bartonella raoultii TaxID=1457020 RepID=A0ABS7I4G0_9HYPH|nr:flagellar biosynthetic protein FliO [Bartonella raoultii]MBX4335565.1 flagellar biosynthetic protein FliO [Bartonella raoultii]
MYVWLSNKIDTSAENITISLIFFIITIAAITIIILLLRRLNARRFRANRKKNLPRLTLCDKIAINRTHQLVLVRCDDTEHLLLIGGLKDVVIESTIINTNIRQKAGYQQKKEMQTILTTTQTNPNPNFTEQRSFSVNEKKNPQSNTPSSFMRQHMEDSAITAEIEGRQEPSLSIPPLKK